MALVSTQDQRRRRRDLSARRLARFLCCWLLLVVPVLSQKQRPKVQPAFTQQFVGRLLLIPSDARPISWRLPRAMARIASYEIILPPRELLGDGTQPIDPDQIVAWVKTQNSQQFNGAIIALDTLAGWSSTTANERVQQRLDLLNWLRQSNPALTIYGFAPKAQPALSAYVFDDLWLDAPPDAAPVLVAKFLQRTHQRPIKWLLTASAEVTPQLRQTLAHTVAAGGGQLLSEGKADVYLFVHTPNTDAAQFADFTTRLANTAAAGYYVALADIAGKPEAMIAALRERKQMDALQAYAASAKAEEAIGKVLAHCTARLITAKVLRPKLQVEQLKRAERAHVEALLTRYLEDWGYATNLRARVEQHVRTELKAEPGRLGDATEQVEAFANTELKLLAEELFRTQFRYNLHSVLMGDGTRADFQVLMLQLFKARFPLQRIDELELNLSIHLALLVGFDPRTMIR